MIGADSQRPSASAAPDIEAKKPSRRIATVALKIKGEDVFFNAKQAKRMRLIGVLSLLAIYPFYKMGEGVVNVLLLPLGFCLTLWGCYCCYHLPRIQARLDQEDEQRDKTVKNFASQQVHGAASVNAGANLASDDEFQIDLPPKS